MKRNQPEDNGMYTASSSARIPIKRRFQQTPGLWQGAPTTNNGSINPADQYRRQHDHQRNSYDQYRQGHGDSGHNRHQNGCPSSSLSTMNDHLRSDINDRRPTHLNNSHPRFTPPPPPFNSHPKFTPPTHLNNSHPKFTPPPPPPRYPPPPPPPLQPKCPLIRCALGASHTKSVLILPSTPSPPSPSKHTTTTVMTTSHLNVNTPSSLLIQVQPLLVLDLNGILCHRIRERTQSPRLDEDGVRYRESCGYVARTPIIKRSNIDEFLTRLSQSFTLAVWTSATKKTANYLLQTLFPLEIRERLLFVWGQNYCDATKLPPSTPEEPLSPTNNHHYKDIVYIKSLQKIWREFPLWNETNTLLMDDSPEKCPIAFQNNTIHPPPLSGLMTDEEDLDQSNMDHQVMFFQKLAEHYSIFQPTLVKQGTKGGWKSSEENDRLLEFLEEEGKGHMGWRGGQE